MPNKFKYFFKEHKWKFIISGIVGGVFGIIKVIIELLLK